MTSSPRVLFVRLVVPVVGISAAAMLTPSAMAADATPKGAGSGWSRPQVISAHARDALVSVAGDGRSAVAAWVEGHRGGRWRIRAVGGDGHGSWGRTRTIYSFKSQANVMLVSLSQSTDGRTVALGWVKDIGGVTKWRTYVSVRRAGTWLAPHRLGTTGPGPDVAVSADGTAIQAGWKGWAVDSGGNETSTARVAQWRKGTWSTPARLGPGDTPEVAVSGDGRVAVAAYSRDDGHLVLQQRTGKTWGPPSLGPQVVGIRQVGLSRDGGTARVAWIDPTEDVSTATVHGSTWSTATIVGSKAWFGMAFAVSANASRATVVWQQGAAAAVRVRQGNGDAWGTTTRLWRPRR